MLRLFIIFGFIAVVACVCEYSSSSYRICCDYGCNYLPKETRDEYVAICCRTIGKTDGICVWWGYPHAQYFAYCC